MFSRRSRSNGRHAAKNIDAMHMEDSTGFHKRTKNSGATPPEKRAEPYERWRGGKSTSCIHPKCNDHRLPARRTPRPPPGLHHDSASHRECAHHNRCSYGHNPKTLLPWPAEQMLKPNEREHSRSANSTREASSTSWSTGRLSWTAIRAKQNGRPWPQPIRHHQGRPERAIGPPVREPDTIEERAAPAPNGNRPADSARTPAEAARKAGLGHPPETVKREGIAHPAAPERNRRGGPVR